MNSPWTITLPQGGRRAVADNLVAAMQAAGMLRVKRSLLAYVWSERVRLLP